MPRNTRQWARRKLEMATGSLDNCGQHLFSVAEIYRKAHPEISKPIDTCLESIKTIMEFIDMLRPSI